MDKNKLHLWQERLSKCQAEFDSEVAKMDKRERVYGGDSSVNAVVENDKTKDTPHVRNIAAEIIEAQVDSSIPKPKVTARRKEDEQKAKLIEDMLINELDRLPFETLNDMLARTVPIQGGAAFLVEWDNTKRTHTTIGELAVSTVHPKQLVPQSGVFSGVEDMDYIIVKMPQTKEYILRKYGIDVSDETENEPDIKGLYEDSASDLVTQYFAYYRNKDGGIGMYSWVNDTEICDYEDYQARRFKKCAKCGGVDAPYLISIPSTSDGDYPLGEDEEPKKTRPRGSCQYCGASKWEFYSEDFEEVHIPITKSDGTVIPGEVPVNVASEETDALSGLPVPKTVLQPTRIPYYKPDIYPVILIKNVSVYGKLLGDSDIDKIYDQQNMTNRLSAKISEKLIKSGSYMSLPPDATIEVNSDEMKVIRVNSPADLSMIQVFNMQAACSQDMEYRHQLYEEARQAIGITDSFQGRVDRTATSGKAKEFAAAQSAGRLASKQEMKRAAYAALFEAMFKFKLAYADEPRPVASSDIHGNRVYEEFNRYDFLEKDAAGEWYWNDDFLFSCDSSAPLATNREAMWQETRLNFQSGTFGNPQDTETLILFWTKMEQLHYPGAAETKKYLEEQAQKKAQAAHLAAMQQQQMQNQIISETMDNARADAMQSAQMNVSRGASTQALPI